MDLPQVDTCCFGLVPLKTGSMIAGLVTLIIELTFHGYATYYSENWLSTVYAILVLCGIVSSALLIFGVYTENKLFVKFYLISFALLIIATIVLLIIFLLNHRGGNIVNYILNSVIYILVVGYCLVVVNSYFKTMA